MSEQISSCPKCAGSMERGFVMDRSHAAMFVSQWAAGVPHPSYWTGTKMPSETIAIGGRFAVHRVAISSPTHGRNSQQ